MGAISFWIEGKEPKHILPAITHTWFRVYGPPKYIISDQEGALFSDEGSIWADRWGIEMRPKPRNAHAQIIERRNDMLRQQYNRNRTQAREEGIRVTKTDLLDESVYVLNAMTSVHGQTPYVAVFGRVPVLLQEVVGKGPSADDETGG